MMNMLQACAPVAKSRPDDSMLVATMGAMFTFDMIEGPQGNAKGIPTLGGTAGLLIGFAAAKLVKAVSADDGQADKVRSRISSVPLMGGAACLGLGLALAQPDRAVVVVDGDASLMLELSGLATVARAKPRKFLHVVIHNGTQFTGLGNLTAPAAGFDFAGAARVAGYVHAERIEDAQVWEQRLPALLAMEGPVFVELAVDPVPARTKPGFVQDEMPDRQFERMGQEALRLQQWLRGEAA